MEENTSPVSAVPTTPAPQAETTETGSIAVRHCYCGCGELVGEKSFYRPGHDSRHVGIVARQVVASEAFETITTQLPTVALQFKAWTMAYRLHQAEALRQSRRGRRSRKAS